MPAVLTSAAAARKFIKANPKADGKAIITGVKETYGLDISIANVYNQRWLVAMAKQAKTAKMIATRKSNAKGGIGFINVDQVRIVVSAVRSIGGVENVRAVLDLIEAVQ